MVRKGSLVRLDGASARTGDALVFQYNPERLNRRLQPGAAGHPQETISCTLVFDATDALEIGDDADPFTAHGVTPAIAALELLTHGTPPERPSFWDRLLGRTPQGGAPPILLFTWGPHLAVPVRITRLDIAEELHDSELRPLRVSVRLQMAVVAEPSVPRGSRAAAAWRAHIKAIETMAELGYDDVPLGEDR
jgi:hypothetical protein